MGGADRIVRAEAAEVPGLAQVVPDPPALLDEAAERALAAGRARGEHHGGHVRPVGLGLPGVDALADGARGVAALEAHGREQQVGERVQQVEAHARKLALPLRLEGAQELLGAQLDGGARLPRGERRLVELDEDALAAHLGGREPLLVARGEGEHRGLDRAPLVVELALQVGADGVEPAEAHLHAHLAQLGDDDEPRDAGGQVDPVLAHAVGRELHAGIGQHPRAARSAPSPSARTPRCAGVAPSSAVAASFSARIAASAWSTEAPPTALATCSIRPTSIAS